MGNEIITNKILHGDCLEMSNEIESGSVDLILTDLPYGTAKGMRSSPASLTTGLSANEWDDTILPQSIYEIANRILRKNGKMVLFSQEPYTTRLVSEAIPNVPFSYRMIWEKDHFANSLLAKKAPVSYYEDILIFSKTHDTVAIHPLREYASKVKRFTNYSRRLFYKTLGHGGAQHFLESNKESSQFGLCTERTYRQLINLFKIDEMVGFMEYSELKFIDDQFKRQLPSVFNLWEGKKYKSNILKYKKDYSGFHPTQKPVLLLEDLIKTFSNEGDLVVDLTCGSGSTAVAAVNTNRNFICIEQSWDYCEIANERVKRAKEAKTI